MRAELEIHNVIMLGSHGAVVIGHVQSGAARVGDLTQPLPLGGATRRLEVTAVERLSSLEPHGRAVGLIFRRPPRLDELKQALPVGSIFVLESP
jgi:translation elongation factor EF-Tu-like GTPase